MFALCLDSLGQGEELNVHVSKPPKDGSTSASFIQVGSFKGKLKAYFELKTLI